MKLTLQTQLFPERDYAARLKATIERFDQVANWLAGPALDRQVSNKIILQRPETQPATETPSASGDGGGE